MGNLECLRSAILLTTRGDKEKHHILASPEHLFITLPPGPRAQAPLSLPHTFNCGLLRTRALASIQRRGHAQGQRAPRLVGRGHLIAVSQPEHAQSDPACPRPRAEACGARPHPPASVPAPWSAAPPPRGVPGRSSPPRRPRAARGRREYSLGLHVGRLARGWGGAAGRLARSALPEGPSQGC